MSRKSSRRFYDLARDWLWFARRLTWDTFPLVKQYRNMAREERKSKDEIYEYDRVSGYWVKK